jgi:hypothetical protein
MRFWTWLLARLIAIAVLLGLALWYRMPASGEREFRRTIEALNKVNSVHYSMVSDVPSQHTEQDGDLMCTDDALRQAMHLVLHQNGKDATIDQEIRRVGNQQYTLQRNGLWSRGYPSATSVRDICQDLGIESYSQSGHEFQQMVEHGIIEKGDKKTIDGDVCREWKVTLRSRPGPLMPRGPSDLEHRTICLGVDDHLPREMTSTARLEHWTFTFNTSAKIETPTDLVPEPVHDNYQPPPPGLTLSDDKDDNH